jgi:hypothetical protein
LLFCAPAASTWYSAWDALLWLTRCLQDVWDLCWASDNPELLALMEKGRMYVLRGSDPEEPVNSSACLAGFSDLQVCSVLARGLEDDPQDSLCSCCSCCCFFNDPSMNNRQHVLS